MYYDSTPSINAPPPLLRNPGDSVSPSPRLKTLSLAIPTSPSLAPAVLTSGATMDEQGLLLPTATNNNQQQQSQSQSQSQPQLVLSSSGGFSEPMPEELPPSFYHNNNSSRSGLQLNTGLQQLQNHTPPQLQIQAQNQMTATTTSAAAIQTESMDIDTEIFDAVQPDVEDLDEDGWARVATNYEIVEIAKLGEGTSGSVTKCRLRYGNKIFALKTIPANPNPDIRKQILRELLFNKTCDSPHIVKYYGRFVDEQNASISIAMEYCAGRSLDAVYKHVKARGGRIGERVLGKIAEGVLSGLSYLHERKIIHRGKLF